MSVPGGQLITDILSRLDRAEKDIDEQQRNIYIVAGVLGAIDLALIIALAVLLYLIMEIKKTMREAEAKKKVEEEINAQKFTAYTGEEMHRKLMAASNPAVPLKQTGAKSGAESEYAFNAPFVDNRVITPSSPNVMPAGSSAARFNRF